MEIILDTTNIVHLETREPATTELIRCKDCAYDGNPKKCLVAALCDMKGVLKRYVVDGNWFCADGIKKE